jgi:ATP-binding cassette subfamily B (MDR/TAP) protein 1
MAANTAAGAFAEEVLTSVRTVVSFGGEAKEMATYRSLLAKGRTACILHGATTGLSGGLSMGICFATYGLAFWIGIRLMTGAEDESCNDCPTGDLDCLSSCSEYTPRNLLTVFFCILWGGWNLSQAAPYLEAVNKAKNAAAAIFHIIRRIPVIDSNNPGGATLDKVSGELTFAGVDFAYPSRPQLGILRGFSLSIPAGKMVALVGTSGCGKSTCIQLLQRFYDPLKGNSYM